VSEYVFKLPDLGEGTVEAEIVEWHVRPGDVVSEGDVVADVLTDKANIEVPAAVSGRVLRTSGEPGDLIAVGAELIAFETDQDLPAAAPVTPIKNPVVDPEPAATQPQTQTDKVITSPAIRRHAKEAGIDLGKIAGSGPRGRILRADLDQIVSDKPGIGPSLTGVGKTDDIKVIGVRRVIANRLQASKREIPHFAYVEEIDMSALESLRARLNDNRSTHQPNLTYLPFIALALIRALRDFPQCNAHFDTDSGTLRRYQRVHLGIATQSADGLKVPVVHNADTRDLWDLATEIIRLANAARENTASRTDLTGSTITITSLGAMGGIVTTPIINAPEVAIVGVNKAVKRPVVIDDEITVRLMMNLSSCFDHRFVDGFEAASMIQSVKGYLEEPATIFID
jgi:2-oxoisovalerate dehydrogenase E2 component (dihydrolipoyl transacylase)